MIKEKHNIHKLYKIDDTRFNVEKPSMRVTTMEQSPKQSTINKENTTNIHALRLDTLE